MAVAMLLLPLHASADSCSPPGVGNNCTPNHSIDTQLGNYTVTDEIFDQGARGFRNRLTATLISASTRDDTGPNPNPGPVSAGNPNDLLRIYCRRDDYAFLPPGAVGGLPCDSGTVHSRDPRAIAVEMWSELPLPRITLGMNPRKGMVAVPTWFWIDGYDGSTFGTDETLLVPKQVCHRVADRDAGGNAVLDGDGHVSSHDECTTVWDSLSVEIGVWPQAYDWDFGDGGQHVGCPGLSDCPVGVGRPYTDPYTASPIAHAYTWSSLGVGGAADAYPIQVGITFGAHFRFSINGQSGGGWEPLQPRQISTSTTQKVQEAQAVLSRP